MRAKLIKESLDYDKQIGIYPDKLRLLDADKFRETVKDLYNLITTHNLQIVGLEFEKLKLFSEFGPMPYFSFKGKDSDIKQFLANFIDDEDEIENYYTTHIESYIDKDFNSKSYKFSVEYTDDFYKLIDGILRSCDVIVSRVNPHPRGDYMQVFFTTTNHTKSDGGVVRYLHRKKNTIRGLKF